MSQKGPRKPLFKVDDTHTASARLAEPFYMKVVSWLKPIYKRLGADPEMVYLIVQNKFLIDSRKDNRLEGVTGRLKEDKNPFFGSLWVYFLMGAFCLFTFRIPSVLYQVVVFFFFLFVMLIATLVSQFSTILLDLKSQLFLSSKPISKRTLQVAKSTHIIIYVMAFSLSLSLFFIMGSFFFHGLQIGLAVLVLTAMTTIWSYIFTTLIYAVALVHLDGETLKNIIVYFQITLMAVTFLSYHLFGQLYNIIDLNNFSFQIGGAFWQFVMIPIWFAAPIDFLLNGLSMTNLLMTGLLVFSTILLLAGFMHYGDSIDQNLQKMNTDTKRAQVPTIYQRVSQRLSCHGAVEKVLFNYYWHFLREDREFKTRLYPAMISTLIVPVVFIYSIFFTGGDSDFSLFNVSLLAYVPYTLLLLLPNVLLMIQYSKHYQASWVYQILPDNDPELHIQASAKAVLSRLFFPIYVVLSLLVFIFSLGQTDLVVLINGWLTLTVVTITAFKKALHNIPFSQPYDMSAQNIGCVFKLITFIAVVMIVGVSALIQIYIPFGEWVLLIILIGLTVFLIKKKK